MTRVIFVRHGEAEGNVSHNFHGHFNSNLTPNGYAQAERAAQRLKDELIDVIYASDLTRTLETAKPIAKIKNLDIHLDEQLREINGGDWENVAWDELPNLHKESYDNWLNSPHLLVMPNGESMVDFQDRLLSAVKRIVQKHEGENICIVTHGTAIKVMLCEYYGKLLSEMPEMLWHDNASISIVEFDDFLKPTIISEGENEHLGELSTFSRQDWWKREENKEEK